MAINATKNTIRRNIYIIYTGGTIGMKPSMHGYIPAHGFIEEQMSKMPELKQPGMPGYVIKEFYPAIDSANMTPTIWNKIALDIAENYQKYDGFLILHGTDTMAYTASALSFMLENLNKPVILTGSQLPLADIRNDARAHLITALLLASQYDIAEVCIYFDKQLLRGNRSRKIDTHNFSAFVSPNYPALIKTGIDIIPNHSYWQRPNKKKSLHLQSIDNIKLAHIRLFPGLDAEALEHILQKPISAVILETYGSGNAPNNQPDFLAVLKQAIDRNIVIINCTQCWHGGVNMSYYATGNALKQIGVINAYDMTPEAIIAKLYYLFSKKLSLKQIQKQMQKNLRGELRLPNAT